MTNNKSNAPNSPQLYPQSPDPRSLDELVLNDLEKSTLEGLHSLIEGITFMYDSVKYSEGLELYNAEQDLSIPEKDALYDDEKRIGKLWSKGVENKQFAKIRLDRTMTVIENCLTKLDPDFVANCRPGEKRFVRRHKLAELVSSFKLDGDEQHIHETT